MFFFLSSSMTFAENPNSCIDKNTYQSLEQEIVSDPLGAAEKLESLKDCDDKFALLYSVDTEIASRCRDGYYYGGRIYPKGWYKEEPNKYEKFMMSNLPRFESGSEGSTGIKLVGTGWTKLKIKSTRLLLLGDMKELRDLTKRYGKMETGRCIQNVSSKAIVIS